MDGRTTRPADNEWHTVKNMTGNLSIGVVPYPVVTAKIKLNLIELSEDHE